MKQTAVEWLIDKYIRVGAITTAMVEHAKEMDKNNIIKAFNEGESLGDKRNYTGIDYYNETFKTE